MQTLFTISLVVQEAFILIAVGLFATLLIIGWRKSKSQKKDTANGGKADLIDMEIPHEDEMDEARFRLAPLDNLDEEYMNLFSNPPMDKPARRGKSAYLRDAYHERIRQIVNALNIEGVNISTYVDMVLTDHLMRYETQIDNLLQNCYGKTVNKKKQWQPS